MFFAFPPTTVLGDGHLKKKGLFFKGENERVTLVCNIKKEFYKRTQWLFLQVSKKIINWITTTFSVYEVL